MATPQSNAPLSPSGPVGAAPPCLSPQAAVSLADSMLSADDGASTHGGNSAVPAALLGSSNHGVAGNAGSTGSGRPPPYHGGSPMNATAARTLSLQNVPLELVGGELEQTVAEFGDLDGPPVFEKDPHSGRPTGVVHIKFASAESVAPAAAHLTSQRFYAQSIRVLRRQHHNANNSHHGGGQQQSQAHRQSPQPGQGPTQPSHSHLRGSRIVLSASNSMSSSFAGQNQTAFAPSRGHSQQSVPSPQHASQQHYHHQQPQHPPQQRSPQAGGMYQAPPPQQVSPQSMPLQPPHGQPMVYQSQAPAVYQQHHQQHQQPPQHYAQQGGWAPPQMMQVQMVPPQQPHQQSPQGQPLAAPNAQWATALPVFQPHAGPSA